MGLIENTRDAFSVLMGMKRVVAGKYTPPERIGSSPKDAELMGTALSSTWQFYRRATHLEPQRDQVYDDMDDMFQYVLASAAMEAYCEDATQPNDKLDRALWATSPSPRVTEEIHRMLDNIELDDSIFGFLYELGKNGDLFGLHQYSREKGVFDVVPLEPRICARIETTTRELRGFGTGTEVYGDNEPSEPDLHPWDMTHWRLRTQRPKHKYGTPFFYGVRLVYKILKLMEEQLTIYRMNMHPDRLLFKIYTGNASPDEAFRITQLWRRSMERVLSVDHGAQRFNSQYAPWAVDQSLYWPVPAGDTASGVDKFPGCFTGDTKVSLLDGREVPIADLCGSEQFWVYACDPATGAVVPGRGHSARLTKRNAPIVEVTVDNGERIRCTPDHRFMLRDGAWKQARHLSPQDSLMPLYRRTDRDGYELVRSNRSKHKTRGGVWAPTHRLVVESLRGRKLPQRTAVHHRNHDRREEGCPHCVPDNHRVVSVRPAGTADVYDITVDGLHNFALTAGVFVHNSVNSGEIFDVVHIRDLCFAGWRVPKAYMGFEDSQGYRSEDTLSQQSVKFARGVKQMRRYLKAGFIRICRLHLELRGINSELPENQFTLHMAPVSFLDEAHKAELYAKRFESVRYMMEIGEQLAGSLEIDRGAWGSYVLQEFAGLDPAVIARLLASPGQEGQPDLTYAAGGAGLTFEGLTEENKRTIREAFADNDKLREAMQNIMPIEDLDDRARLSSTRVRFDIDRKQASQVDETERQRRADKARERSALAEAEVGKVRERRLHEELRALASSCQEGKA